MDKIKEEKPKKLFREYIKEEIIFHSQNLNEPSKHDHTFTEIKKKKKKKDSTLNHSSEVKNDSFNEKNLKQRTSSSKKSKKLNSNSKQLTLEKNKEIHGK